MPNNLGGSHAKPSDRLYDERHADLKERVKKTEDKLEKVESKIDTHFYFTIGAAFTALLSLIGALYALALKAILK